MTQAQLDLHNLETQLEQPSSDLTTQLLLNDSPALFLELLDTFEPNNRLKILPLQKFTLPLIIHMKLQLHRKKESKL